MRLTRGELFVTADGEILVNEVAPRPHNSGHHTIEACYTSQFEQHVRAVLDLPLGSELKAAGVMANLVGAGRYSGDVVYQGYDELLGEPGVNIHIYGKAKTRPFRKWDTSRWWQKIEINPQAGQVIKNDILVKSK